MFDPAVIGTLLIGLNAVNAQDGQPRREHPRRSTEASPRGRRPFRVALAGAFRRAAAALDAPPAGEVAQC
jgi:hypothetical protein